MEEERNCSLGAPDQRVQHYLEQVLHHHDRDSIEALSSGEPKPIFSNVAHWKILAEDHHSIKPQ